MEPLKSTVKVSSNECMLSIIKNIVRKTEKSGKRKKNKTCKNYKHINILRWMKNQSEGKIEQIVKPNKDKRQRNTQLE